MIQKTYFKTKDYCKVNFSFTPGEAKTVEILGLNGDWDNAIPLKKKKDGSFGGHVSLPKNTQHEFRYRINASEWANDPDADSEAPNSFGSSNSVITI